MALSSSSSSSSSSLQDMKVVAPPRQSGINRPSIPSLDSLSIPSVTNPSNIVNSYILVPVTTYDVVIGIMASQVSRVDSYYRLGVHE